MGLFIDTNYTHLLRLPQAIELTSLSRASFYRQVKDGLLPCQVHIGPNSVAWLSHELDAVLSARISGYSEAEIKSLVKEMTQQRQSFMENK